MGGCRQVRALSDGHAAAAAPTLPLKAVWLGPPTIGGQPLPVPPPVGVDCPWRRRDAGGGVWAGLGGLGGLIVTRDGAVGHGNHAPLLQGWGQVESVESDPTQPCACTIRARHRGQAQCVQCSCAGLQSRELCGWAMLRWPGGLSQRPCRFHRWALHPLGCSASGTAHDAAEPGPHLVRQLLKGPDRHVEVVHVCSQKDEGISRAESTSLSAAQVGAHPAQQAAKPFHAVSPQPNPAQL